MPISNETDSTTYYAKACIGNICSDVTSYEVKLDKTGPELNVSARDTNNNLINVSCSSDTCSNSDWISVNLAFDINASDTLSGLSSKEVIFRYSPAGQTFLGELTGSSTISLDSNNKGSRTISSDGYRHYQFEICDIAGNCTTKNMKFMVDNTAPSVTVSMGYTGVSGNLSLSCTSNKCTNDSWLNDYITLYFNNAKDTLSGLNNNATFSYNSAYLPTLDKTILGSESLTFVNGYKDRKITGDGSRYVTLKICDNVNNCVTKEIYFKIDAEIPIINLTKKEAAGSGAHNITFECETMSGVSSFYASDAANGKNDAKTNNSMTYWHSSSNPTITISCKNKAGTQSDYTYSYICGKGYCCYSTKQDLYYNGSSVNNICSSRETVSCGGITHKKYTNCHTGGLFEYEDAAGNPAVGPALNYYSWSECNSCDYSLQFVSSSKN